MLTGPSGRLFRPMADTMAFALVGSLLCTLTLLPVLCAYFLRKHVKEPEVPLYERIRDAYGRLLDVLPAPPRGDDRRCASALFAASLLLVPFIGAEFMPHLDEGSLWVRATMPYTISFEEASKLGPQVRGDPARASRRSRRSPTSWGAPTMAPIRSGSSTTSTSSA